MKVADEVEVELDASLEPRARRGFRATSGRGRASSSRRSWSSRISRASVEAQYSPYEGYVNKRNEILGKLAAVPDQLPALKADLSLAVGGIKNHEIYFEHLGGEGGDPRGAFAELVERDRLDRCVAQRFEGDGMAGRGWAWTAYDWDVGRLFNYIGDAQSTFPIWNATPLIALDVYEHAYFLDFQTDRGAYIDAFFDNLDWVIVNDWISQYELPLS